MLIRLKPAYPISVIVYDGTNADEVQALCPSYLLKVTPQKVQRVEVPMLSFLSKYPPNRSVLDVFPGDALRVNPDPNQTPFVIRAEHFTACYERVPDVAPTDGSFRARIYQNDSHGACVAKIASPTDPLNCTVIPDPPFEVQRVFVLVLKWVDGPAGTNWHALVSTLPVSPSAPRAVSCPGGYVGVDESPVTAACRVVLSESGVGIPNPSVLRHAASSSAHSARGWCANLCYVASVVEPIDEITGPWTWVPLEEIAAWNDAKTHPISPGLLLAVRHCGLLRA